jgi:hypothetical protein
MGGKPVRRTSSDAAGNVEPPEPDPQDFLDEGAAELTEPQPSVEPPESDPEFPETDFSEVDTVFEVEAPED